MKKILLIGQAPPLKPIDLPFGRSQLYKWFETIGLTYKKEKDFEIQHNQEGLFIYKGKPMARVKFGALIDYFPGLNKAKGHLAPTPKQILESRPSLERLLKSFDPDIVVPIGKLSMQECLSWIRQAHHDNFKLEKIIGQKLGVDPYGLLSKKITVIPLPHPSGASTWIYQKENKALLSRALTLLKNELD